MNILRFRHKAEAVIFDACLNMDFLIIDATISQGCCYHCFKL